MAVVITYRGSGIINLATGADRDGVGVRFWALKSDYFGMSRSAPLPAVDRHDVVAILVGVLSELLVFRPLRTSSPLAKLVASLGILLILQATMLLWFGSASKQIPSVFPKDIVEVFGKSIPENGFWMAGVVAAHRARARRPVPLDPVRSCDAGSGGERGVRHARRAVAEPALDGEHGAGVGGCRRDGHRRRSARPGRLDDVGALHRAGAGGGTVRRVHVALDRLPRRLRHRDRPVADGVGGRRCRGSRPTAATRSQASRRCSPSCCSCSRCRSAARSLPSRGELVEKRLPFAPRPRRLARPAVRAGGRRRRCC